MGIHDAHVNVSPVKDDLRIKAWTDLCDPCLAAFRQWQCAPNPSPRLRPEVQRYPQLVALLDAGGAGGPSPAAWRQTISEQLLLIRRICTGNKDGTHGDYTPLPGGHRIDWNRTVEIRALP